MPWYVAHCEHPTCRVLTYRWTKPGDSCPACGWLGSAGGEPHND